MIFGTCNSSSVIEMKKVLNVLSYLFQNGFFWRFQFLLWLKELSWCITGDGSLLLFSSHFADIGTSLILGVPTASCPNTLTIGSPNFCPCIIWLYNQILASYGNRFPTAQFDIPLSVSSLDFLFGAIWSHLQFIGVCGIAEYVMENFPGLWLLWISSERLIIDSTFTR